MQMFETKVLNSQGKPVLLTQREHMVAQENEKKLNALGFQIDITSLTAITKKVTEQKFYHIAPAKYLPVRVGEGAWSTQLTTYRAYYLGDDFTTGIVNLAGSNSRLASVDVGVDSVNVPVQTWAKRLEYSIPQLMEAQRSGNWDLVTSLEKSRKMNWDLGIQKVAFLGISGNTGCEGYYTLSNVNTDASAIPQAIGTLDPANLSQVVASLVRKYRQNSNFTAWPTKFVMPELDYLACVAQVSPDFPIKTILDLLRDAFRAATMNPNFEVLPNAYGNNSNFSDNLFHYVMSNDDDESIRMDIPVDYTNTIANTVDNFQFQNAGYGQFTGVKAYRPLEVLYFTCTNTLS